MVSLSIAAFLLYSVQEGQPWIPEPGRSEKVLAAMTRQADSLVIYNVSKSDRVGVLYRSKSAEEVREFGRATGGFEGTTCICMGNLEVELQQGGKPIGSLWMDGSMSLGMTGALGRVRPKAQERFAQWFAARGVTELWDEYERIFLEPKRLADRWRETTPSFLKRYWPDPSQRPSMSAGQIFGGTVFEIPDPDVRVRRLLAWYASTNGEFEEDAAAAIIASVLLRHDEHDLVRVIETLRLNPDEASGAARLVALYGRSGFARHLSASARDFLAIHAAHGGIVYVRRGNLDKLLSTLATLR